MNRRDFFGLMLGWVFALGRKPDTSNNWTREILMPHHPPLSDPGHSHPWQPQPRFDPWYGNWPIEPVYNGPGQNYTLTWHNTGINEWPNIS